MRFRATRNHVICSLAFVVIAGGSFVLGFSASLQLKHPADAEQRRRHLMQSGDASPRVRSEVLAAFKAFQDGYAKRDPNGLDRFMEMLFARDDDVLLIGTDANEWARGYSRVAEFIKQDWLKWGDLRLAVDNALVWSSGDVAWLATTGVVHGKTSERPVRLAAVLTRRGGAWTFRQLQFQWDERDARTSDLLDPGTHLRIADALCKRLRLKAAAILSAVRR